MDLEHPIDAEIRAWLARHVENQTELSEAIGRSGSWLHKYVNGAGHATIDDLVRLAGLLMGLNLPALTNLERKILKAIQELKEPDQLDVLEYAEHRVRLARRELSTESSEPAARTPVAKARRGRGKR